MINQNNQNINFDLPEETDLIDVIYEILSKNNIKDSPEKWAKRENNHKESQAVIIKNAAVVLFKKIAPDEKVVELLQKHLDIPQETAKNILTDIKLKLIPYAKTDTIKQPLVPTGVKSTEIKSVEENAKINQENKKFTEENKNIILKNTPTKPPQIITEKKGPDTYREPIE